MLPDQHAIRMEPGIAPVIIPSYTVLLLAKKTIVFVCSISYTDQRGGGDFKSVYPYVWAVFQQPTRYCAGLNDTHM